MVIYILIQQEIQGWLTVFDAVGNVMLQDEPLGKEDKTILSMGWDGKNKKGMNVAGGTYLARYVVKQIVDGLISPVVGFIIGGVDLAQLKWTIVAPHADKTGGLVLSWGAVLSALITLIATALVIYALIHVAKLDRIDRKKA